MEIEGERREREREREIKRHLQIDRGGKKKLTEEKLQ
jgi:hypothetical protein